MKNQSSFFIVMLLMICSVQVMAQRGQGRSMDPEQMATRQTERMEKELNLDKEQLELVSEINLKYATKMKEIREANRGDREGMREGMMAMRDEWGVELKEVLSEEQWAGYQKMVEENRRNRPGPGRRRPGQ